MSFYQLLSATLLFAGLVQNGPRVSARLSGASARVTETVMFHVVVENAGDDVRIGNPRFPAGLDVVGTQDYSEAQYSIPGGRHVTRRREFALLVSTAGRFRIAPVDVVIGNRTYRTNPVELVVTGAAQTQAGESTDEVWLHATMSPETVYVGQQSTLTVEAGFSDDVRVRLTRPPVFDTPSPTGFWVQDVPGGPTAQIRTVNGRTVEVQALQRAYFPLSAGKFAFAPARVVMDVRQGFLFAPETREIRSPSPRLVVLSLPDKGKPDDFRGAVGAYTIRAFIQPDTVAAGEAAQVTIEISGNGNIKGAPPPMLPAIGGVEQFAPTEEAKVSFDGPVVRGTKQFQWVIIPGHAGKIVIPAIAYSFFDPVAHAYKTARSEALTLAATPASTSSGNADGTMLEAIRSASQHASLRWTRSRWFLWVQAFPLLMVLTVLTARRLRGPRSQAVVLAGELQRIQTMPGPFNTFLRDVEAVVRNAAAFRAGNASLRTAEVRKITQALSRAGVGDDACKRVAALIGRIERQRFAPAAAEAEERESLLAEAKALVRVLDDVPGHRAAFVPAVLILAALVQGSGDRPFEQGTDLYRSGRFMDAAHAFEKAVREDSTDIAAWANFGNASFRAGDRGRAVWAWARAVKETPRDRALVRNLQAAGAVEVLRTRPPLSVRPEEWYFLAAVLWWIAGALAVVVVLRARRLFVPWVLALTVTATTAFAIGAWASQQSYAVALEVNTRLHGDPTTHSPVVKRVPAGTALDVLEQRGEWLQVRTLTQVDGWVEADAVGRL